MKISTLEDKESDSSNNKKSQKRKGADFSDSSKSQPFLIERVVEYILLVLDSEVINYSNSNQLNSVS